MVVETILVTGATGTVGSEVIKQLSSATSDINIKAAVHSVENAKKVQYDRVEAVQTDEPIQVPPSLMILGRRSLIGWPAGTSIDSQDTLSFSVLSGVRSMNQVFPLERAAEAYDLMMSGKARFRCVLTYNW
jgi:D-arabinose 1-dehydrogenase-like Zn-dependent alcohol dehydrogenase